MQRDGDAPAGRLVVTGSLCFGGVKACCRAERTISICNMGECALHVTSVHSSGRAALEADQQPIPG